MNCKEAMERNTEYYYSPDQKTFRLFALVKNSTFLSEGFGRAKALAASYFMYKVGQLFF